MLKLNTPSAINQIMNKKTILITGSSSGIGKSTAHYFAERGWNVAATMRNPDATPDLLHSPNIRLYKMDVTDEASIAKALTEIIQDWGRIDVLVNNAGYGAIGAFEAASAEQCQRQFNTNVFGIFNTTRAILPYFRKQQSGTIINVSSMGGRITFPLYSLYHGTKWAVEGFSESLQYELRSFNIRIKIIEPGAIKTDFYNRSQDLFHKEGLTAYDDYISRNLPYMQKTGENAPGPEIVAKTIYKAASDGRKKIRYPVGNGAPLFLFLRAILPLRTFMWLVRFVIEKKK